MRTFPDFELFQVGGSLDAEIIANSFEGTRRKKRYAYLAWLCFGSHYLYLRRPAVQALFWLTAGGLLLWWLIDLRRIPALVKRQNLRAAEQLRKSWQKAADELRARQPQPVSPWAMREPQVVEVAPPLPNVEPVAFEGDVDEVHHVDAIPRRSSRTLAGFVLAGASLTAAATYAFSPPPLSGRASLEPSFRTIRAVNVRASPNTSGRVRTVIGKGSVLKGRVEKSGSTEWLWITRGAHADNYVALHNLKKL